MLCERFAEEPSILTQFHARRVRAFFSSEQRERTIFNEPSGSFGLRAVSPHSERLWNPHADPD
jgi:hypothetical protein